MSDPKISSAFLGAIVLALLLIALAPQLAPMDPITQFDPVAARHLPPGSQRVNQRVNVALQDDVNAASSETLRFLLGTDRYGRDLLSRLLHGIRLSFALASIAVLLSVFLGVGVGSLAALSGGFLDTALMRVVEGLQSFPKLLLVLVLAAWFGAGWWPLVLVLGATSWMELSRLVRAELLSLKEQDFALAARAVGRSSFGVLVHHLLPHTIPVILVHATLRLGELILLEAALSFLGFGIQPPIPSLGNMIADGRDALTTAWWVAAIPGAALTLIVLGVNLLGDRLQELSRPVKS